MKSENSNAKSKIVPEHVGLLTSTALIIFLLMELPVRLWLQPDPWLLDTNHWYFIQPLRLIIELTLVALLLVAIRWAHPNILQLHRSQMMLLLGCMLASAILFGLLEAKQLTNSFSVGISQWLAWFLTGFCIGIGQELLYRGLLFSSFSRFMSVTMAAGLTTVAFVIAPLHSVRLWEYALQEHFTVVAILVGIYISAGVFFQWLRNFTGSVTIPALVHGVGNAITWVAVFA